MTDTTDEDVALVVRVPRACEMLAMSKPTLYALLHKGAIESYVDDGGARKILLASIKDYVKRKIEAGNRLSDSGRGF
jgi:excisionase family DNA binding protein